MLNLLGAAHWRKAMKFEIDQLGIWNRYERERLHWDSHLNSTKQMILRWIDDKSNDNIVVYGSGWLLDVPIVELYQKFRNVYLIDINHPPLVCKRYSHVHNVHFIEADITGCAQQIFNLIQQYGKDAAPHVEKAILQSTAYQYTDAQYQVSVNVLSQLDTLIVEYLRSELNFDDMVFAKIRNHLQAEHIKLLGETKACLITDVTMLQSSDDGKVIENKLIVDELLLPAPQNEWIWDFDLKGYFRKRHQTRMKVKAYYF